jgi:signal transduction histidine kinase
MGASRGVAGQRFGASRLAVGGEKSILSGARDWGRWLPVTAKEPQSAATVLDQWVYRAGKARLRLVAITCAVLAWGITQLLHFLLYPVVDETMILRRMPADMLGGILVGWLLYRVMDEAYGRRLAVLERLQIIARLNHQIRNALHVISLSAYTTQNKTAIDTIGESVDRINRSLREVLPEVPGKAA